MEQNIVCDLRAQFTHIRDQGTTALCWPFAASDLNAFLNQLAFDLSVEYLAHHAYEIENNSNYASGLMVNSVISALSHFGQPAEAEHQYEPTAIVPKKPTHSFSQLFFSSTNDKSDILISLIDELSKHRACVICIHLSQSFFTIGSPYELDNEVGNLGGHAVVAVGMAIKPNGKKYFLIRNSWGGAWGKNGHCWLSEEFITQRAYALITV